METRIELDAGVDSAVLHEESGACIHHKEERSPQQFGKTDLEKNIQKTKVVTRPLFLLKILFQHSLLKRKRLVWKYLFSSVLTLGIVGVGEGAIAQILRQDQVLRPGDGGPQVTQLQEALSRRGYFNGPITGTYGLITESAVRRFQQDNPFVAADGVYGPATEAALFGYSPAPPSQVFNVSPSPAPSSDVAGSRTLSLFDQGDDVEELQRLLRNRGYNPGPLDGVFGTATQTAVRAFQQANGLAVDGVVGSSTWRALGVIGGGTPPPSGRDVSLDVVLRQGRYVVVVPGNEGTKLTTIERELGRTAYRTRSGRGSFLTPGGYSTYRAARSDVLRLRAAGLDARVEYF